MNEWMNEFNRRNVPAVENDILGIRREELDRWSLINLIDRGINSSASIGINVASANLYMTLK